jgi:hypothetical protein
MYFQIYWSALFSGESAPKEQQRQSGKTKYQELEYTGVARHPNTSSGIFITEAHPFVLSEMTAPATDVSTLVRTCVLIGIQHTGKNLCTNRHTAHW